MAGGEYVLYWMQQSQRPWYNHALEYAIEEANKLSKPLVVAFGISQNYPGANLRHYQFMFEGLRYTKSEIEKRGARFVIQLKEPANLAIELAKKACILIGDKSYLRPGRSWREMVRQNVRCAYVEVESDIIVPVEAASVKEEFSAGTIRRKINRLLKEYLVEVAAQKIKVPSQKLKINEFDISDIDKALIKLKIDTSVKPVREFVGGQGQALARLRDFIENKLADYAEGRNDPNKDAISNMSPYLHFGQISALQIALEVMKVKGKNENKEAYLEELIVRRELAANFCYYNRNYDNYDSLPSWAKTTLEFHKKDKRSHTYSLEQLELGQTYDPYWNAAQLQMVITGKMHGYMRMYWGKKILEWTRRPEKAYEAAVYLNDKYNIDGRDFNGYAGIAWCFGKHDRAWANRWVFGKVRYMNDKGLERKFDAKAYAQKIELLKSIP